MSESDPEQRNETARRLPVKTWLFAAALFIVSIRLLTTGER